MTPNMSGRPPEEWGWTEDEYWQKYTLEGRMKMMAVAQEIGVLDIERKERAKRAMAHLTEVANG